MRHWKTCLITTLLTLTVICDVRGEILSKTHVALAKRSTRSFDLKNHTRRQLERKTKPELDASLLRSAILDFDSQAYDLSISGTIADHERSFTYPLTSDEHASLSMIRESYFHFMRDQLSPEEREAKRQEAGQLLAAMYLLYGAWRYSDAAKFDHPTFGHLCLIFPEFKTALKSMNQLQAQIRNNRENLSRFSPMIPIPRTPKTNFRSAPFFMALRKSTPTSASNLALSHPQTDATYRQELHEAGIESDSLHAATPTLEGFRYEW